MSLGKYIIKEMKKSTRKENTEKMITAVIVKALYQLENFWKIAKRIYVVHCQVF